MTLFDDLLIDPPGSPPMPEPLAPGAVLLHRFAVAYEAELLSALDSITASSPFRHMVTPGGYVMSVGMTNCGALGWVSDKTGYRYDPIDPITGKQWPALPEVFLKLADEAAGLAGFPAFIPDACLVNKYEIGAKLSLHQDRNEVDYNQPIVSVSLGIPAVFLFGGMKRADKQRRVSLTHGDVVVWGGPARLRYHGILPLKEAHHTLAGNCRINLTFRKAG